MSDREDLTLTQVRRRLDTVEMGDRMHLLLTQLYPVLRSRTGPGVRETLRAVSEVLPLEVVEVPSGTPVLDWTVPPEWRLRDAYVRGPDGTKVIDVRRSSLHVVGESVPVHRQMDLEELRAHLHTLPEQPDLVPYRHAYGRDEWGFCLSQRQLEDLPPGRYEVVVDATLEPGHLTYGEAVVPGSDDAEVILWAHVCHPSLANDNLSGVVLAAFAGSVLAQARTRLRYRIVLAPALIGAITWLARNEERLPSLVAGLVLAGVGDAGALSYKRSRRGGAWVDRAAAHVVTRRCDAGGVHPFSPYGYDERQFGSPGFDLPVGRLSRTPYGEYPEYHTSGDDPAFVSPASLGDALDALLEVLDVLERDGTWWNTNPRGEPHLARRGLFDRRTLLRRGDEELALLWVLNLCDGTHSLLDVADRSGLAFDDVAAAASVLVDAGLLSPHPP